MSRIQKRAVRPTDVVTARNVKDTMHNAGVIVGSFHTSCGGRERGFLHWIVDQVPEGKTLADSLLDLAQEVYRREKEAET